MSLNHFPRDFLPVDPELQEPSKVAADVHGAVSWIFEREGFAGKTG
jgi:hypothetical protein